MSVEISFVSFLAKLVDGKKTLNYEPGRLSTIIKKIANEYPVFKKEAFDVNGHLKDNIYLYINGKDYRKLSGVGTVVEDNQKIIVFKSIIGG